MEAPYNYNSSTTTRRQPPPTCYIEEEGEDNGLASSLDEMDADYFCGSHEKPNILSSPPSSTSSRPIYHNINKRRSSLRNMSTMMSTPPSTSSSTTTSSCYYYNCGSPRLMNRRSFYDARYENVQTHFLDSCFLCKKPLGDNKDIFMYRGDTPFCSEECRAEQMENDEAKERNWNLSSSLRALRQTDSTNSTSPTKTRDYTSRTTTTVAAAS